MPELPDVQVFKELADATSLHRRIEDVLLREEMVEEARPQWIRDHLREAAFAETRRHGKHLFLRADGRGWLRLHFGMTGDLVAYSKGDMPDHTRLRIDFTDGSHLAYICIRKFGAISWVDDVDDFVEERGLGPDAIKDLDVRTFGQLISRRRGSIKGTLMSQQVVAGLGNIYVDEILFQAGIHPESDTERLGNDEVHRLFDVMVDVVEKAVDARARVDRMPDHWLLPHRETDLACPRDDRGTIEKIEVSGRPTYVCARHQKKSD